MAELHDPDEHEGEFRRGFVSEIHCTLDQFVGRTCETCPGHGRISYETAHRQMHPEVIAHPRRPFFTCPTCSGTGNIEGIAVKLFREHPISSVVLTDRRPIESEDRWNWFRSDCGWDDEDSGAELPPKLFAHLPKTSIEWAYRDFESQQDAFDALFNIAAPTYARSLAFPQLLAST